MSSSAISDVVERMSMLCQRWCGVCWYSICAPHAGVSEKDRMSFWQDLCVAARRVHGSIGFSMILAGGVRELEVGDARNLVCHRILWELAKGGFDDLGIWKGCFSRRFRLGTDWADGQRPTASDAVVAIHGEEKSTAKDAAVVPPICMPRALRKVKVGLRQKRRMENGVVGGNDLAVREAREHAKWMGRLVAVVEAQAPLGARPAMCLPWRVLLVVRNEKGICPAPDVHEQFVIHKGYGTPWSSTCAPVFGCLSVFSLRPVSLLLPQVLLPPLPESCPGA